MSNKTKVKEIFATYDRQIKKDMDFWIKYRPSRWGDLLPEKPLRPFIKFIKSKRGHNFFFIAALIFSLLFVGVIPTLSFIWSNIFRLWLTLLVIPFFYWALAITFVYSRVIVQAFSKYIRVLFYKLIDR